MSIKWYNNQPYHSILFHLCLFYCKTGVSYVDLYLDLAESFQYIYGSGAPTIFKRAIQSLAKDGAIEVTEKIENEEEFNKCLERAREDKRIKDPRSYCMRKTKAHRTLYIRPKPEACSDLYNFLKTAKKVIFIPSLCN